MTGKVELKLMTSQRMAIKSIGDVRWLVGWIKTFSTPKQMKKVQVLTLQNLMPLTEFLLQSRRGDQIHIPSTLGITTIRAPALLLLAGKPTCWLELVLEVR